MAKEWERWAREEGFVDPGAFTERDNRFIRLHTIAQNGQFSPRSLRSMSDDDLIYLDGHQEPEPSVKGPDRHKLQANAVRARAELDRRFAERASRRTNWWTAAATVLGLAAGFVGGVLVADFTTDPTPVVVEVSRD